MTRCGILRGARKLCGSPKIPGEAGDFDKPPQSSAAPSKVLPLSKTFCGTRETSLRLPKTLRAAPKLCEAFKDSVERCQADTPLLGIRESHQQDSSMHPGAGSPASPAQRDHVEDATPRFSTLPREVAGTKPNGSDRRSGWHCLDLEALSSCAQLLNKVVPWLDKLSGGNE